MIKSITYTLTFSLVFLLSCNVSGINDDQGTDIPESFRQDLETVFDQYLDLKDVLVESDAETAAGKADQLAQLIDNADYSNLDQESRHTWSEILEKMQSHSYGLSEEDDIEDQRIHFDEISRVMIDMVTMYHPVDYDIYHQQCTIFGDGTADWLSRDEEIRNPYYGERMMDCGNVMDRMSHGHGNGNHHDGGGHHH